MLDTLRRCIDNEIDLMSEDQIHQIRRLTFDLIDLVRMNTVLLQRPGRAARRENTVADRLKAAGDVKHFKLI